MATPLFRGHFGAFVDRGLVVVSTQTCSKHTWWVSDIDIIASLSKKVQAWFWVV